MASDEYGSEYFRYESAADARHAMNELTHRAREEARVEGVTRRLNLIVEQRDIQPRQPGSEA